MAENEKVVKKPEQKEEKPASKTKPAEGKPKPKPRPKKVTPEEKAAKIKADIQAKEEELAKKEEELRSLKGQANKDIIKNVACTSCGAKLGLNIDEFFVEGFTSRAITCPKCEMVNAVTIIFSGEPDVADPLVKIEEKGLEFINLPINALNPEQIKKRISYEVEVLMTGKAKLDPRVALVLRALDELLN